MIHGIESGANGMIEEFRMYDPEGYIVGFFRWHSSREESNKLCRVIVYNLAIKFSFILIAGKSKSEVLSAGLKLWVISDS